MKKAAIVAGALLGLWVGLKYLLPISTPFVLGAGLALAAEPGLAVEAVTLERRMWNHCSTSRW